MKGGVHVDMRTGAADVELTADVRQRDVLDQSVYAFSRPNLFGIRVYEVLVVILAGLLFPLEPCSHPPAPRPRVGRHGIAVLYLDLSSSPRVVAICIRISGKWGGRGSGVPGWRWSSSSSRFR